MPSFHHQMLLDSSLLHQYYEAGSVKSVFLDAMTDPIDREEWPAIYTRHRLIPDAQFVIRAGTHEYAERRHVLEQYAGFEVFATPSVSIFVAVEADISSALNDQKLTKYAGWWAWFDCSDTMVLVVICIDRYGHHRGISPDLLFSAAYGSDTHA